MKWKAQLSIQIQLLHWNCSSTQIWQKISTPNNDSGHKKDTQSATQFQSPNAQVGNAERQFHFKRGSARSFRFSVLVWFFQLLLREFLPVRMQVNTECFSEVEVCVCLLLCVCVCTFVFVWQRARESVDVESSKTHRERQQQQVLNQVQGSSSVNLNNTHTQTHKKTNTYRSPPFRGDDTTKHRREPRLKRRDATSGELLLSGVNHFLVHHRRHIHHLYPAAKAHARREFLFHQSEFPHDSPEQFSVQTERQRERRGLCEWWREETTSYDAEYCAKYYVPCV